MSVQDLSQDVRAAGGAPQHAEASLTEEISKAVVAGIQGHVQEAIGQSMADLQMAVLEMHNSLVDRVLRAMREDLHGLETPWGSKTMESYSRPVTPGRDERGERGGARSARRDQRGLTCPTEATHSMADAAGHGEARAEEPCRRKHESLKGDSPPLSAKSLDTKYIRAAHEPNPRHSRKAPLAGAGNWHKAADSRLSVSSSASCHKAADQRPSTPQPKLSLVSGAKVSVVGRPDAAEAFAENSPVSSRQVAEALNPEPAPASSSSAVLSSSSFMSKSVPEFCEMPHVPEDTWSGVLSGPTRALQALKQISSSRRISNGSSISLSVSDAAKRNSCHAESEACSSTSSSRWFGDLFRPSLGGSTSSRSCHGTPLGNGVATQATQSVRCLEASRAVRLLQAEFPKLPADFKCNFNFVRNDEGSTSFNPVLTMSLPVDQNAISMQTYGRLVPQVLRFNFCLCGVLPWRSTRSRWDPRAWYQWCLLALALLSVGGCVGQSLAEGWAKAEDSQGCRDGGDPCVKLGPLSDIALSLGPAAGLVALGAAGGSEALVECHVLLVRYAQRAGFVGQWMRRSWWDLMAVLAVWGIAVLERLRGSGVLSAIGGGSVSVWALLHVASFVLSSGLLAGLAHYLLFLCRGLSMMLDWYCNQTTDDLGAKDVLNNWDVLQAMLQVVSSNLEHCFAGLQVSSFAFVLLSVADATVWQAEADISVAIPGGLVFAVVAFLFVASASITEKCLRVPPYLSSILDLDQQHLINYIASCAAGFYVFDVRLTSAAVLKSVGLSVAIAAVLSMKLFPIP